MNIQYRQLNLINQTTW